MAVNHLVAFTLTLRLLPQLKAAPAGRVVATSSGSHFSAPSGIVDWFSDEAGKYRHMAVYGKAKLATVLFTQELSRSLAGTTVTAHSFHPGFVRSGFGTGGDPAKKSPFECIAFLAISPAKGAETGVFLIDAADVAKTPGLYWVKRKPAETSKEATAVSASRLWEQSDAAVRKILSE